ncbi:MAG TPA: TadE/TadG family type IV pilus assembly protein [Chakrabartia sp.]|jgi:hypothetical protein|nr:TadE/TadG family type IV pilus assembly protein [Chakrabartia sp.]
MTHRLLSRAKDCLDRAKGLWSSTSGIAIVEFALSLPLFVGTAFGGIEVARYVAANMQVSQLALMVADNAGRVRGSIDESDIEEVMIGARTSGEGVKFGQYGRVILSSLEPNGQTGSNAGQMIRWQRCFGLKSVSSSYGLESAGTTNATLATGMGESGNKITALPGATVMFVEVFYDYQPLVMDSIIPTTTLHYTAAYTVRERATQTLSNLGNISAANKRLCSRYSST